MKTQTSELVDVLNDLVRINNDRIAGYEKAANEIDGTELKMLFNNMAGDSRKYISELSQRVHKLGGESAEDSTIAGKIYRAWMDVKTTFAGKSTLAVLETCEYGEDAAQKAYGDALASDADMDIETRQLIASQKSSLKESHDVIKKYRDAERSLRN